MLCSCSYVRGRHQGFHVSVIASAPTKLISTYSHVCCGAGQSHNEFGQTKVAHAEMEVMRVWKWRHNAVSESPPNERSAQTLLAASSI